MGKLQEKCMELYSTGKLNCAEAMIMGSNEVCDLGLDDGTYRCMGSFGAGCGCGRICGALAGGVAAIGAKYCSPEGAKQTPGLYKRAAGFMKECMEAFGGTDACAEIRKNFSAPEVYCLKVIEITGSILEKYMDD